MFGRGGGGERGWGLGGVELDREEEWREGIWMAVGFREEVLEEEVVAVRKAVKRRRGHFLINKPF